MKNSRKRMTVRTATTVEVKKRLYVRTTESTFKTNHVARQERIDKRQKAQDIKFSELKANIKAEFNLLQQQGK